jgi:hypothetical protein
MAYSTFYCRFLLNLDEHNLIYVMYTYVYMLLVGQPEGKRPLGRPRRRLLDNVKMGLGENGWDGLDWIAMAQDYWVSGICSSSGILNTRKHNISETGSVSVPVSVSETLFSST